MELCAFCKVEETALYESGVPICLKCVALQEAKSKEAKSETEPSANIHKFLIRDLADATLLAETAATEFSAVTSDIPSSFPPPDGTQRIHNASRKLTEVRNAMMKADRRLRDYLERGIVPEDLKRSNPS